MCGKGVGGFGQEESKSGEVRGADGGGDGAQVMKRKRKRPTIWQCVKKNIYTHRRRKTQRGDDVMICQCSPREGRGCGSNCINRVLNLECVQVLETLW